MREQLTEQSIRKGSMSLLFLNYFFVKNIVKKNVNIILIKVILKIKMYISFLLIADFERI